MKKQFFKLFLLVFGLLPMGLFAQDTTYARQVINKLTALDMHGRGYVEDGDEIAAHYIKTQMEILGVLAFDYNFYQDFTLKVNTFPGNMKVSVDGEDLRPGADFLVKPSSASASGNYELIWFDLDLLHNPEAALAFDQKDKKKSILVIDTKGVEDEKDKKVFEAAKYTAMGAKGIIILQDDKLTWGVSQEQSPIVELEILREQLPRDAKNISLKIEARYNQKHRCQNILGFIEGSEEPDSFIVFTAHYDHLGHMGKDTYFPGANDNASGIAMLLSLADYYAKYENQSKYSIAFIAFGAEEAGLVGSKYYVDNPVFPLEQIKFLLNLDLLGTGEEGITVVNATKHENEYQELVDLNEKYKYLAQVKKRGPAANSDHYFFAEKDVPAFFIYTMGGVTAYHDIYDKSETLPLTEFEDVFRLLTKFAAGL